MDVHRATVTNKIPAPDAFKDKFTREHLSLVFRKEEEQFIFLWFDGKWFIVQYHFAAREIDDEIIEGQLFLLVLSLDRFTCSSRIIRERRNCALTRAINSRMEKGLVR